MESSNKDSIAIQEINRIINILSELNPSTFPSSNHHQQDDQQSGQQQNVQIDLNRTLSHSDNMEENQDETKHIMNETEIDSICDLTNFFFEYDPKFCKCHLTVALFINQMQREILELIDNEINMNALSTIPKNIFDLIFNYNCTHKKFKSKYAKQFKNIHYEERTSPCEDTGCPVINRLLVTLLHYQFYLMSEDTDCNAFITCETYEDEQILRDIEHYKMYHPENKTKYFMMIQLEKIYNSRYRFNINQKPSAVIKKDSLECKMWILLASIYDTIAYSQQLEAATTYIKKSNKQEEAKTLLVLIKEIIESPAVQLSFSMSQEIPLNNKESAILLKYPGGTQFLALLGYYMVDTDKLECEYQAPKQIRELASDILKISIAALQEQKKRGHAVTWFGGKVKLWNKK